MKTKFNQILIRLIIYGLTALLPISGQANNTPANNQTGSSVSWQAYNQQSFRQAREQNKLILIDLKAVWCHWCHVMDQKTYANPRVINYLRDHYVAIQVDHDARPDLAQRYRDWGWPATIILTPNGQELLKHAGFIPPDQFLNYLKTAVETPQNHQTLAYPTKIQTQVGLTKSVRDKLIARHFNSFDPKLGGLKLGQKFIDGDAIAWDLLIVKSGYPDQKPAANKRIRMTLDHALALIDPAFGGIYQYSTYGDWSHPHYEKIMRMQWISLKAYAKAYQQLKHPTYRVAAQQIGEFLMSMLNAPDGGFYSSQDADLIEGLKAHDYFTLNKPQRLKQGLPKIDKHEYAAQTGMAADALLSLYQITDDKRYLTRAEKALAWAYHHRRLGRGGYRHGAKDTNYAYLSDTLYMATAWLHDYQITGNALALQQAQWARDFMAHQFQHPIAGLLSAQAGVAPIAPLPQVDQNIQAADFLLSLYQIDRNPKTLALLKSTLRYLDTPKIALARITDAGILLLNEHYTRLKIPPT